MKPQPDPVGPGQTSVWKFPRPAVAQPCGAHVVIQHEGMIVADTRLSILTLETSHPPSYYIPLVDIARDVLRRASESSLCEWKGIATYWDVVIGDVAIPRAGWSYPDPSPAFEILRNHVAFYAAAFNRCSVDGQTVVAQAGAYYGGWITPDWAGPFKGVPGSMRW